MRNLTTGIVWQMKTGTWLVLFCISLCITVILGGLYSGMSDREPLKSPVFSVLMISGIFWVIAGLVLVWHSIPVRDGLKEDRQSGNPFRGSQGTVRIATVHWIGMLIACLACYPALVFLHLDQYTGYCVFNAGIAVLGIVASGIRPEKP
jgi:type VI protein secretion system component VasK